MRQSGTARRVRRLLTLVAVLALCGLLIPSGAHHPTRFTLLKAESAQGMDAADNVVWILALGSDARPGQPVLGSRSDAIQLVGVNAKTHHAVTIGIPRDSYVSIPGHGHNKINSAMVYGGPHLTAQVVGQLMGIRIDYVFVTSFGGLIRMVNKIGGVTTKVTWPMNDIEHVGHAFQPGMRHLNGGEALAFARTRHGLPRGDFSRQYDQGQLLRGALATIRSRQNKVGTVEHAVSVLANNTRTDLNPVQLYRLARTVLEVNPDKVRTCVVNGSVGWAGPASVVFPDVGQARALGNDVAHDATVNHGC